MDSDDLKIRNFNWLMLVFDTMFLRQISPFVVVFMNFLGIGLLGYNDRIHTEEAL